MTRRLRFGNAAFVAAAVLAASCASGSTAKPNADALYVSPTGSPSSACTQPAPCGSFDRAYRVARPGQVVQVLSGSYPSQSIKPDPSKSAGPDVVFRTAGTVALAGLRIEASHLEIRNLSTVGWSVVLGAASVTLRNVTSTSSIFVTGASNISVIGGSAGPVPGQYLANGSQIKAASGSTIPPRNILIDGVTFHDFRKKPGTSDHVDCLHILSGTGITIRNSRFSNCEAFAILFTVFGAAGSPKDIVVENNFMECCASGFYSLQLGGGHGEAFDNVLIRNNSTNKTLSLGSQNTLTNVTFRNNIAPNIAGCRRADTNYNVLYASSSNCGTHDIVAPAGFADPAKGDFHLVKGAAAIGHGDGKNQPMQDIDGQLRPRSLRSDIGADQREPALMVLGRSIGAVSLGTNETAVTSFYGAPLRRSHTRAKKSKRPLSVGLYRASGGVLTVTYSDDVVVGVSTSSRFYTTSTGLGVASAMQRLAGSRWSPCRNAYRRYISNVAVYVAPAGGRRGKSIGRITMVRRGYGDC